MISQNEKISKLEGLLKQGKIDSVVSLLKDESFKTGLNQNNPAFMFFMYKLYSTSEYSHSSAEKARDMLNKSAQLKHPDAYSEKGKNLLFGIGCKVNIPSAEDSFRQSLDCEQSRYYIAEIYLKGMAKDSKNEGFFDYVEAKEQLKVVVSMKGAFYKSALLKLAIIILNQEAIDDEDERVILEQIFHASKGDGLDAHNAKVILGKYYLRKLKATFTQIKGASPINPDKHFDLMVLADESKGLLNGVEANLKGLGMMPETI